MAGASWETVDGRHLHDSARTDPHHPGGSTRCRPCQSTITTTRTPTGSAARGRDEYCCGANTSTRWRPRGARGPGTRFWGPPQHHFAGPQVSTHEVQHLAVDAVRPRLALCQQLSGKAISLATKDSVKKPTLANVNDYGPLSPRMSHCARQVAEYPLCSTIQRVNSPPVP